MTTAGQPGATAADGGAAREEERRAARWQLCAWLFLGLLLAVRLATFLDYGVTWDEPTERRNGALTVRWYASGMHDAAFLDDRDQYLYGSFFNVLARSVCRRSPLGYYETQHLLLTVIGCLTTLVVYFTAAHLAGPLGGLLAAVCLTLTPSFYGHSFNNPKDIPFAALYALAVLLLVRAAAAPLSAMRIIVLGVTIGLAAGVRMVGLGLLVLASLLVVAVWLRNPAPSGSRAAVALRLTLALAVLSAVAFGVMLLWWPYVQMAPLSHAWDVVRGTGDFRWFSRTTLFSGQEYRPGQLPWTYVPTWLLISLPEFYFLALLAGGALLVARWRHSPLSSEIGLRLGVVLLAAGAPLAGVLVLRPVMYDAIRHLLFIVPPLAVLAGTSAALILRRVHGAGRVVGLSLLVGSMALTAYDMVRLHPYQYVYFNRLLGGGLAGAAGRFETDYWGLSYKEAVAWLQSSYRPGSRGIRVANCSEPFLSAYELDKVPEASRRFVAADSMESADVVLAITRWGCHRTQPGRVVHIVARQGVGLCYVFERAAPGAAGGAAPPAAHAEIAR